MKKALDELERYEDTLLRTVKQASTGATEKIRAQWAGVLKTSKLEGTDTGAQAAATMEQYGAQFQAAIRDSRAAGLKVAHAMTRNYATRVSGVLIGLSEGLQHQSTAAAKPAAKPAPARPAAAPPAAKKTAKRKVAPKKPAAKKAAAKKATAKKKK